MLNDRIKILLSFLTAYLLTTFASAAIAQHASGTLIKYKNGADPAAAIILETTSVTGSAIPFFDRDSHYGRVTVSYITALNPVYTHAFATNSGTQSALLEKNKDPCDAVGNPILPKTGTKTEVVTLFSLPGEMGLKYVLYYSGGWHDNLHYDLDLSCEDAGDVRCTHTTLHRPDGSSIKFSGGPTATAYTEMGGGGLATLTRDSVTGNYTLHDEDALTEVFDASGFILSITGPSGVGWTFSGNRVTHTNGQSFTVVPGPVSETQQNGYNIFSQTTQVTDPAGNVYTLQYGNGISANASLNDVGSIAYPGSPATLVHFGYVAIPPSGHGLSEIDYNDSPYMYTTYYSGTLGAFIGWATGEHLADGSRSFSLTYTTDSNGYLNATLTNPLVHTSTQVYGGVNGQLSLVSDDAVQTCGATTHGRTYDPNGNLSAEIDNNGNTHTYNYAVNGQLQTETEAYGTPQARTTDYQWDPNVQLNRLSSVTVEGVSKTVYTYNPQNRMASVAVTNLSGTSVSGQTLTTTYQYTLYANGMVHTLTVTHPSPNNSDTEVSTYDTLGNLVSLVNGLGQTTTYSNYNGLGEVGRVSGPNGDTTAYAYDARGRVSTKTTYPSGTAATWSYTYDGFGLPYTVTAPGGLVTTWNRDAEMRVTSITQNNKDGVSTETFGYDANNDVTSHKVSRGSVVTLSASAIYDGLGRPYQTSGAHGEQLTYGYDGNGNVISVANAAGHVTRYQYDALDRLTVVSESGGASVAMPTTAPSLTVPANSTSGSYTVSWTAIGGAAGYTLQQQVNGGSWATVQSGAATSWSTSGKGNGNYGYHVRACNATGCGPWSATGTTNVAIPSAPTSAPSLSAPTSSTTGSYSVSWGAVSNTSNYILQEQVNGGAWTSVQNSTALSWSTSGRPSGNYGYRAEACNAVGCGPWSSTATVSVTIPAPPSTPPALSAPSTNNNGSYTISWTGVSGATSYELQEQVNGGAWGTVQNTGATSWSTSGKTNGNYGYQARSCNVGGCSGWSPTSTTVVTIPVPIAIDGQSYNVSYGAPQGQTVSVSIGFDITGGNTWQVFSTKPGVGNGHVVAAQGTVPAGAVTVQYTWTDAGVPGGDMDTYGSISNPASSPVAVSSNPFSQYTTGSYTYTTQVRSHTYKVRVDFFNAAGADISSSTCTLQATVAGTL